MDYDNDIDVDEGSLMDVNDTVIIEIDEDVDSDFEDVVNDVG